MENINLSDYYSAGYFVIRRAKRPFWLNEPIGLVPDEMLSLESEFCPKFDVSWVWGSPSHRESAIEFGIEENKVSELAKWISDHHQSDIDIWSMFHSLASARTVIEEFIPVDNRHDLMLIGTALHHSCYNDWMDDDNDSEGVVKRISEKHPLELGGEILGFDVASYAHHNFDHSWYSHHHHQGIYRDTDIRPGQYGLLTSRGDALTVSEYATKHELNNIVYEYWLITAYPLVSMD